MTDEPVRFDLAGQPIGITGWPGGAVDKTYFWRAATGALVRVHPLPPARAHTHPPTQPAQPTER